MNEKKQPHERLTEKNNGLKATQEVLYAKDFKRADNALKKDENEKK
ncbi:hypothetical protein HNO89_001762 [Sporosarcina luteola]|nr:hypothetical protein [Sporosarcina luteola]